MHVTISPVIVGAADALGVAIDASTKRVVIRALFEGREVQIAVGPEVATATGVQLIGAAAVCGHLPDPEPPAVMRNGMRAVK